MKKQIMVKIPTRLEDLVPPAALEKILDVLNQPSISGAVREAMNRVGLKDVNPVEQVNEALQQAKEWVGQLAGRLSPYPPGNPQWINATGTLIGAQSLGFPMAPTVAHAMAEQAMHFHDHSRLEQACIDALAANLVGFEAVFTSSLASAIQLTRHAFQKGFVSRADMVRIPGFGDLGSMLLAPNRSLFEVGATNGAMTSDWQGAHPASADAIFLVSPNALDPSANSSQRQSAIEVARANSTTVVDIAIDGTLIGQSVLALPQVGQRLAAGANLVIIPLDGFIGGPPGAAIIGDARHVRPLRQQAHEGGWSLHPTGLAGLAVALNRTSSTLDFGILDLMSVSMENLRDRAKRIQLQLTGLENIVQVDVVELSNAIGPSPWNQYRLQSVGLSVAGTESATSWQRKLALGDDCPAIHCGNVDDRLVFDLRFVPPRDDHELVRSLSEKRVVVS